MDHQPNREKPLRKVSDTCHHVYERQTTLRHASRRSTITSTRKSHIKAPPCAEKDQWKTNIAVFTEGQDSTGPPFREKKSLFSIDPRKLRSSCMNEQLSLLVEISLKMRRPRYRERKSSENYIESRWNKKRTKATVKRNWEKPGEELAQRYNRNTSFRRQ